MFIAIHSILSRKRFDGEVAQLQVQPCPANAFLHTNISDRRMPCHAINLFVPLLRSCCRSWTGEHGPWQAEGVDACRWEQRSVRPELQMRISPMATMLRRATTAGSCLWNLFVIPRPPLRSLHGRSKGGVDALSWMARVELGLSGELRRPKHDRMESNYVNGRFQLQADRRVDACKYLESRFP